MPSFLKWFRRTPREGKIVPGYPVDWAPIIWAYAQSLWPGGWNERNSDRSEKECNARGLAFGQVRIIETGKRAVTFKLFRGKDNTKKIHPEEIKETLEEIVAKQGLNTLLVFKEDEINDPRNSLELRLNGAYSSPLTGQGWSGANGPFTVFAQIKSSWSSDQYDATAHSEEAVRLLLALLEAFGLKAGPKHYTHESPVKIEDIVLYAVRWEDPSTGWRYLDVLWRPELVKDLVPYTGGWQKNRTQGPYRGGVYRMRRGTQGGWPKITINNRPVYSMIVTEPNEHILEAKNLFTSWECGAPPRASA